MAEKRIRKVKDLSEKTEFQVNPATGELKGKRKVEEGEPIYKWKKRGGGSLRLPNLIVKPNQVFNAKESEIPKAFLNSLQKLDIVEGEEFLKEGFVKPESVYKMVRRGGTRWWDIVDKQGKILNEKGMTEEAANAFLAELE